MVGQGVLRECLLDPSVESVLAIGRNATGQHHENLRDVVLPDLTNLAAIEGDLADYGACFFCLGVSSVGMTEAAYRRTTHDLTLAVARTLVKRNPAMTFIYVSGQGTDATASGWVMWARVKGETETALLKLPFKGAYMFRPGYIQPLHGIVSRTRLYRWGSAVLGALYPFLKTVAADHVTTTEQVGRAMLAVAKGGAATAVLENRDINARA